MPPSPLAAPAVGPVGLERTTWLRVLTYGLFMVSTVSIAGDEFFSILLMAVALWHWHQAQEEGRTIDPLPWWVVAPYFALAALALLSAAVNPHFVNTIANMRGKYRLLLPLALLPALGQLDLKRLLKVYGVCVALVAIYGLIQFRFGVDWFRPEGRKLIGQFGNTGYFHGKGNFSHHLTYAGYMLIVTPLFLSLGLQNVRRPGWGWIAVGVLAAAAVAVSFGRSGWLGAAAGVVLLLALLLPRRWGWGLVAGSLGLLAVLMGLLITPWLREHLLRPDTPVLAQRLLVTSPQNQVDRLHLWEAGLLAIQDRPWLGAGMGNQDTIFEPYRKIVSRKYGGYVFTVDAQAGVHNIYLQMIFNLGWLGLAAYLGCWAAVFAWSVRWLRRAPPFEAALLRGCIAGLAGSMVAGMFENNALDGEVETLILMLMGVAMVVGLRLRRSALPG